MRNVRVAEQQVFGSEPFRFRDALVHGPQLPSPPRGSVAPGITVGAAADRAASAVPSSLPSSTTMMWSSPGYFCAVSDATAAPMVSASLRAGMTAATRGHRSSSTPLGGAPRTSARTSRALQPGIPRCPASPSRLPAPRSPPYGTRPALRGPVFFHHLPPTSDCQGIGRHRLGNHRPAPMYAPPRPRAAHQRRVAADEAAVADACWCLWTPS